MNQLKRSYKNRILFGVCGGIGEYLNVDPVIIRLLFVFSGVGILPYIIMVLIMPSDE